MRKTYTAKLLSRIAYNIYVYRLSVREFWFWHGEGRGFYIYNVLKINSTKSFTTTIMKRHRIHYCSEEEVLYNIFII